MAGTGRFTRSALCAAALLCAGTARGQARLTREEIDRKYRGGVAAVYSGTALRDVVADLARRTGLVIAPDGVLAEYLRTHDAPVTCSMQPTSAESLLGTYLPKGVEVLVDEALGGLRLRTPPAAPTNWALQELVGPISWERLTLDEVTRDIERLTGLRVEVAADIRPLIAGARFDLARRSARAITLVGTLTAGRPIRVEPRADRVVALVSARLPRDEIEARLGRHALIGLPAAPKLQDAVGLLGSSAEVFVDCDPGVGGLTVTRRPSGGETVRQQLDAFTAQVGATWRIEDGVVVVRPKPTPPHRGH